MRRFSFLLIVSLVLTGCQIVSPRALAPTLTPVLLMPEVAAPATMAVARAPMATVENTASPTGSVEPARPLAATAAPPITPTPVRLLALGQRATLILRAEPSAAAAVVARIPGAETLWAEGQSADGAWLWVAHGESDRAWVATRDLQLFGNVTDLPIVAERVEVPAAAPAELPTAAPAPRLAGKIVFQTATGGAIYLLNADGSGLRRLTDGLDPILSPDSAQIAFARWTTPHSIYVLDLRTGQERRVISADRPRSPTWSPDGGQIAFVHLVATGVCLDSPFGCLDEATLRARFGGQDCLVTPLGRSCIQDFPQRTSEQMGIARVNADGQGWLDIPAATDAQAVVWQPGSAALLYRGAGGLQVTGPDRTPQTLVRDAAVGSPAWAPDGTRFVAQMRQHDRTEIFLFAASGQQVAQLTATATGGVHNVAPAWSPDGKSLLFLSNRDGAWRLYRMNTDGSGQAAFLPAALKDIRFSYDFAAERVVSWGR